MDPLIVRGGGQSFPRGGVQLLISYNDPNNLCFFMGYLCPYL